MVLKTSSVLSCLLPARLGFAPNHGPDSPRSEEKSPKDCLRDPEFDPFNGQSHPDLARTRANTAPSDPLPRLLIPNGGVGESPIPAPARQKRSSFTTFFAFSSKRRPPNLLHFPHLQQDLLVPAQSVSGRWVAGDSGHVHVVNTTSVPSPPRADEEEYYYSYYTPAISPNPGASPTQHRQQAPVGNPDMESHLSSVDSHTQIRHPYAYSSPLYSGPRSNATPSLRHTSSQPFHRNHQGAPSGVNAGARISPNQLGHQASKSHPHLLQPELKTSVSTPNLASAQTPLRPRSLLRKKPRTKDRWLSAESWWDAILSPSPRFKIKRAPRPDPPIPKIARDPVGRPVREDQNRDMGVSFPPAPVPAPVARPRAVSVTSAASNVKHSHPALTRSRSAADLIGQSSMSAAPRAGFEPALETLVDEPTPPPEQVSGDAELPLPEPPLSLEQVLDEGEAFEQQRAQWKHQASKSIGNKHTRSFSRARSKSLGEKHIRLGHHPPESSKPQFNLEFLAARTLLGSQSTMPTVHVTKPSSTSSHSRAYSHSHSHSAHSHTHSSHSRAYSHSHSHSLATSHSSKSSRNNPPRGHSRNGSWGKSALLKAGALCGIGQDDSCTVDEKVPSSSRVDVQNTIVIGDPANAEALLDTAKASPSQSIGEVGIAISSTPPENSLDLTTSAPGREHGDRGRCSSKHSHKPSGYAGPHPSAIDSNLLDGASGVSMRHRLPPRPAIHPPIAPIAHPYRSATAQLGQNSDKANEGTMLTVRDGQELTGRNPYPHISLSHADFEQYGVGEALVYASHPQPEISGGKQPNVQSVPIVRVSPPQRKQLPSIDTAVSQPEGRDTSSLAMNSVPSLTSSTIQMVVSAFDNPDDLDEFQDLFYKPLPTHGGRHLEPTASTSQLPTDVHSSASSSPLTHLVRKLSEVSKRAPSRTPSGSIALQRSGSQDDQSNQSGKFVFMDMTQSSSPAPMESSSQLHVPIREGSESSAQMGMGIPEDVDSFYSMSVLESPLEDRENDTFGYPIKHCQFGAVTSPNPIPSSARVSTHASIQEDHTEEGAEEEETTFLSPVRKRFGLASLDAVRASYVTTSDVSQMSGLSDFPLPPSARPVSILQVYAESPPISPAPGKPSDDGTETAHSNRLKDGDGDKGPSDDVEETLRALRTPQRAMSYGSTFGGSDDMDFITELHQAGP